MAAFHKPKVYRSLEGCCICKAKSSSSRFTASAKYSGHFESCFRLSATSSTEEESRGDEICNACVLLVKRFRKLPEGSPRHWAHVVDARAGPGVKNFVKLRRRESCRERARERDYERKHVWRRKSRKAPVHTEEGSASASPALSGFLDPAVWRRQEACCGPVFVSTWGEAVVDTRFLTLPCKHGMPVPRERLPSSQLDPLPSLAPSSSPSPSTSLTSSISPRSSTSSSSSSFSSIESIIESELQNIKQQQVQTFRNKSILVQEEEAVEARSPTDPDADEGFFDKPSVSPVSSLEGGEEPRRIILQL